MKTVFNKTHFLLTVMLISFVMLLLYSRVTTEVNTQYVNLMLVFNGLITALVAYMLLCETNNTTNLYEQLQVREKYLNDTLNNLKEVKAAKAIVKELNEDLEKRVKERTEDLEFFAYSVSHDLRSPLRSINGFAKILKEDYRNVLDDNAKNLLNSIASNAQKMDRLIEDLLKLSRLEKTELGKTSTDMNALVNGVVDDIKFLNKSTPVEIIMNPMPAADCDTGMMKQVWVNLISNAVKYSAKTPNPKVEIGYEQKDGSPLYYVKDNGVGFDMQHAGKLFSVFQRLHAADEYEGTGVGLVIVQRVIKKHGGRVFAEAKPGKGASFYFELPNNN